MNLGKMWNVDLTLVGSLRLPGPCSDAEIASILNISKSQAKEWLERAIQQGWAEKRGKPARYHFSVEKQPGLFGG